MILRGGSEAFRSCRALARVIGGALEACGLPAAAVQILPTPEREALYQLLECEDDVDLVIPRGGEGLIRAVVARSRIPVLKHYKGVCHVYVHAAADLDMALAICENGKVQRPTVCNAVETILVDRAVAERFVARLVERLAGLGVEVRGDQAVSALGGDAVVAATEDDWGAEYLAKIVAVRVVDGLDAAVAHIERWGSSHTETIVTGDAEAAERFLREVGSSTVMVNASTRFADGGELGLGAEIGISTTRLHAYGPMGAEGLTTLKFIVKGDGQVRNLNDRLHIPNTPAGSFPSAQPVHRRSPPANPDVERVQAEAREQHPATQSYPVRLPRRGGARGAHRCPGSGPRRPGGGSRQEGAGALPARCAVAVFVRRVHPGAERPI